MAFVHGHNTEIFLDGFEASPYFNKIDTSVSVETAETTTFGNSWKKYITGLASGTVSGGGFFDAEFEAIADELQSVQVLTLATGGASAYGDMARLGQVRTTSYAETASLAEAVGFAWAAQVDELSFGRILQPLFLFEGTEDNGGSVDDGAQTTAGAVAHLHVTQIDGQLDVWLEDSANGSDWTAIADGEFAFATTVSAQRIEVPGTIRRYVRAAYSLGSNESATLLVAMARN